MIFVKNGAEAGPCIIGVGSPQGPDSLALLLCERLREESPEIGGDWHLCTVPAQLPALMADHAAVVLLDALAGDGAGPRLLTPDDLADEPPLSSHGFGVGEALALARALGHLPEVCHVIGLPIAPDGDPEARARTLLPRVRDLLRGLFGR